MSGEFGPVIRKDDLDRTLAEMEGYPRLTIGSAAVHRANLLHAVEHGGGSVVALRLAGDPIEDKAPSVPVDQPALFDMKEVA